MNEEYNEEQEYDDSWKVEVESLNVSVATGVMLSRLIRGRARGLENEDRQQLRARYYALSVREALDVLQLQDIR